MIKTFLKEHSCHLKLSVQHLGIHGGCWKIEVYNTTGGDGKPIFEHYILDEVMDKLNVDFETAIMVPINNWWDEVEKRRREESLTPFERDIEAMRKEGLIGYDIRSF